MSDPAAMRFIKSVSYLRAEFQNLLEGEWASSQAVGERFSFDILHHQVVNSILLANVVQNANVWVIQAGNGFCFAFKSLLANQV